jgi:hypothetical protein
MAKMSIGESGRDWAGCCFHQVKETFRRVDLGDGDKKGGFAMQYDKNDYRGVLAGLEGVTEEGCGLMGSIGAGVAT